MGLRAFFGRMFAGDGDRSPYGDFWFEPVTMATISGARVSSDTAMRLSAVFRAVSLVSGHMGMFPIRFYESGTRRRIKHPLLKLLNTRPNRYQNAFEWREMMQGHLELRGNAYNRIVANTRGEITELLPFHPDRVTIETIGDGTDYRYRVRNADGSDTVLARGEVWHLRNLSSDGIMGLSTVEYARESLGMGLSAQEYAARFFANDSKPTGGWLEYPGKFSNDEARQVFAESVRKATTGARRHGILALDQGMKYHEVGVTNKDAQFLEQRQFTVTDIARWFGVPPHKLGDLTRATFSNIEQQSLDYVQDALLPRATRWEQAIAVGLLLDDEEIDIGFDFHSLLRGDSAQRATYYHNGILDGWLTRNEARDMEGREPLDGLDEPLRPLNMVEEYEAEDVEADTEALEPPSQEQQEPEDDGEDSSAQRLRALIDSNAARMARRIASNGKLTDADVCIISEALAITETSAASWAAEIDGQTMSESALKASLIARSKTP